MADLLARLEPVFRDVLDNPGLRLSADTSASNLEGWDSLAHVNLVFAIEQEFGVRFTLEELEHLRTVGDIVDLMERKMASGV
ncbi:MAG: acyl carrier protein [Candidatus Acidiferrales bacterium]